MASALSKEQIEALNSPLNLSNVSERKQGGVNLSYIEGYHAINEANRIFGFGGWSAETLEHELVCQAEVEIGVKKTPGVEVGYRAAVKVTVGDAVRVQNGFGTGRAGNPIAAHELAIKEAETDALKRALRTFGSQFGNALYDKQQRDVVDDEAPVVKKRKKEKEESAGHEATRTPPKEEKAPAKEAPAATATAEYTVDQLKEMIDALENEEEFNQFRAEYKGDIKALGAEKSQEVIKYFNDKKKEVL